MLPSLVPISVDVRDVVSAALGTIAVVASSSDLRTVSFTDQRDQLDIALARKPRIVAISPSESFVLVIDDERVCVWERTPGQPILEFGVDNSTTVAAAFGRLGDADILLHEPAQAKVDAYDLATRQRIFSGGTETFLMETATPTTGGTQLAALGYFRGEGKDSLSVIPIGELASPPETLFMRFRKKRPIADHAYRLAVGPCGNEAIVIFRDPEDDEVDEEDEKPANDTAYADIRGHLGFYIRSSDGTIQARRAWDGPIARFARLAATTSWIAAECGERVAVVPFAQSEVVHWFDARWLAASPDGGRVLVQTSDRGLALLMLP